MAVQGSCRCIAGHQLNVSVSMLQVYVDLKKVESGSLYDDFDMLPPKTIKVSISSCSNVLGRCCCSAPGQSVFVHMASGI